MTTSCDDVGWASYLTYSWVTPLAETGARRAAEATEAADAAAPAPPQLGVHDTPQLADRDRAAANTKELLAEVVNYETQGRLHPFMRGIASTFWKPLLLWEFLKICEHFLNLLNPMLLQQVLIFQEAQSAEAKEPLTPEATRKGLMAVSALIMLGLFSLFYGSQIRFLQERITLRITSALRGAVLHRCIQGQGQGERARRRPRRAAAAAVGAAVAGGAATAAAGDVEESENPSVYNVLSFDVSPNVDIIWTVLSAWLFPFQIVTSLALLFAQVQWAVIPGLATIIVAKGICAVLLVGDGFMRHTQLKAKDSRLSLCDEGFNSIRTLHMLAWTGPFTERIMSARKAELNASRKRLWLHKMAEALDYSLSVIVTLVTLSYYVLHDGRSLKASVALPVIALITGLIGPIGQLPVWAQQYLIWRSAYDRINLYIGVSSGGQARSLRSDVDGAAGPGYQPPPPGTVAAMSSCTLTWGGGREAAASAGRDDGVRTTLFGAKSSTTGLRRCAQRKQAGPERSRSLQSDGQSSSDPESVMTGSEEFDDVQPEEAFSLVDLELSISAGDLLVVCGLEGQGKSSLLQGLLGEMQVQAGTLHTPASKHVAVAGDASARGGCGTAQLLDENNEGEDGPGGNTSAVPYAAQTAALFTGTVKSNILFGFMQNRQLYGQVLKACALEVDLATMLDGDLTEVAQGGATLSGGQRARVGLARAVYRAASAVASEERPLVLLDDPFCALDRKAAKETCDGLFSSSSGLLAHCAVVVSTADPWWAGHLLAAADVGAGPAASRLRLRFAVLRAGRLVALVSAEELAGRREELPELESAFRERVAGSSPPDGAGGATPGGAIQDLLEDAEADETSLDHGNPQDEQDMPPPPTKKPSVTVVARSVMSRQHSDAGTQTPLTSIQKEHAGLLTKEKREQGNVRWATCAAYLNAVGPVTLVVLIVSLFGIMFFQNLCTLWIAYWTTEKAGDEKSAPAWLRNLTAASPARPGEMLKVYMWLVICFTACNFAGHGLEIIGGIRAARDIFAAALSGTMSRPFRWWDTNPTGRVLNRFSEDVQVMDKAVTNIMGVIIGAVLYFIGHCAVLAISNPWTLLLLPVLAFGMEYYAKYYRLTIRELQRIVLVSTSVVYQGMTEAVMGSVTIRAFDTGRQVMGRSIWELDELQRANFAKQAISLWIGLRMSLIGYTLSVWMQLQPLLQYFGYLGPQSAALVGFSIEYSRGVVGIIQQFIMNYSDLEMQLVSIERLREYSLVGSDEALPPPSPRLADGLPAASGLLLRDVEVTYREGLPPALAGVSLEFLPSEVVAIVGRTGAGKSSLLLAVLQLVPHTGNISVGGMDLKALRPEQVREQLVGVVPQQPILFAGALRWNLDPTGSHNDAALMVALSAVGLAGTCSLDMDLGESGAGSTLSQGQRQLLCAARALLRRPRVALLDEVTASLPPEHAKNTLATLLRTFHGIGAVTLLVTHQDECVASCDRVVTISAGRVVSDTRGRPGSPTARA